jgi:hypothetical protein
MLRQALARADASQPEMTRLEANEHNRLAAPAERENVLCRLPTRFLPALRAGSDPDALFCYTLWARVARRVAAGSPGNDGCGMAQADQEILQCPNTTS